MKLQSSTLARAQMASSPTLYEQLGGKPAITMVVHDMLANVAADNRINHFFARTNIPHLQMELVNQICVGTGGPCKYTGPNMQQAHKGMNLKTADFNALMEDPIAHPREHRQCQIWATMHAS